MMPSPGVVQVSPYCQVRKQAGILEYVTCPALPGWGESPPLLPGLVAKTNMPPRCRAAQARYAVQQAGLAAATGPVDGSDPPGGEFAVQLELEAVFALVADIQAQTVHVRNRQEAGRSSR